MAQRNPRVAFNNMLKSADKATVAVLNRTAQRASTVAVRAMQADLGATSQKTIRRSMFTENASSNKPVATVKARGKRIPLIELNAKPRTVSKRRRNIAGITWGKGRTIAGSFIARMASGHIGVFKRRGKARLPIDELFGPSAAKVFANRRVQKPVREFIRNYLPTELKRVLGMRGIAA